MPQVGPRLYSDEPNTGFPKRAITEMIRSAILDELIARVGTLKDGKPTRKYMVGISRYIDVGSTTANIRTKNKSPIHGISVQLYRFFLFTVLSGSLRAGDRLLAAGITTSDVCKHCDVRHDTPHLFWCCKAHDHVRQPFIDKITQIKRNAFDQQGDRG